MNSWDALHLNVYQIYPKSFKDSNGDGVGDLRGIISQLDYLKDLGINAIWVCPIYVSPGDDGGYDVADYENIDPQFGTMRDLQDLIVELHSRGMKLIMDFVPNHLSTSHRWFQESRKSKDNPYADYFCWFDEIPNDWSSCFGGSAYQFDESRKQYYLHSYCPTQADLNWDNPKVREELKRIIQRYTAMGVDGFRIDVIDQISKDWEGNRNCFGPHLHEYIHEVFGQNQNLFTVGECWATTIEEIEKHCGPSRGELTTLFQFDHLEVGRTSKWDKSSPELAKYRDILVKWQNLMQEKGLVGTLFTDNHDHAYLLSRLGVEGKRYECATLLATMTYLLRGIPFVYQGTEWGSESSQFDSIVSFQDVEAINKYHELLPTLGEEGALAAVNFGARDNPRHPLAWSHGKDYGFGSRKPWMGFASNADTHNWGDDHQSLRSISAFYSRLLHLRLDEEAFMTGCFQDVSDSDNYFAYLRENDNKKFMVICNFGQETPLPYFQDAVRVCLSNMGRETLPSTLLPYEAIVVELAK